MVGKQLNEDRRNWRNAQSWRVRRLEMIAEQARNSPARATLRRDQG